MFRDLYLDVYLYTISPLFVANASWIANPILDDGEFLIYDGSN